MGCSSSKDSTNASAAPSAITQVASGKQVGRSTSRDGPVQMTTSLDVMNSKIRADKPQRLYKLVLLAEQVNDRSKRYQIYQKIIEHCREQPSAAKFINPSDCTTALHVAARLLDLDTSQDLFQVVDTLIAANVDALRQVDSAQNIPLHYAIAPTKAKAVRFQQEQGGNPAMYSWKERAVLVQQLIQADLKVSGLYLQQNDVVYDSGDATGGCSPLYRALQTLPDDFESSSPTVEYMSVIQTAFPFNSGRGNSSDGDKPLSLLYRRFTRQFDISEQFFAGDNSRPEVVSHRQRYKIAAGNTWKLIELLLRPPDLPPSAPWGIVHRAVQTETPPDLLRYIVETNAQDLTRTDPQGSLPLHYAAATKPPTSSSEVSGGDANGTGVDHFPAFYTKYVMDELLYKFPEAASMQDGQGRFPLTLAVESGKQWIGGGIKSLYDAHPEALSQIKLEEHPSLSQALSMADDDGPVVDEDEDKEDSKTDNPDSQALTGVVKDNHHDAIMLVQKPNATIEEVATSMWAHEEDAGVQMLGCVAIANMLQDKPPVEVMRIALSGTSAVVNAMKAHPNELIVQETACKALQGLASADGQREVSMVASGAVAAIVGAMQAHVGDAGVQEQACLAVAQIVMQGGADRATVVASVSGVTAILNALAAHAQSVGVQVAGLKSLGAMTEHPNANLPDLPRAQTEPLLLAAQEGFPAECSDMVTELLQRMST